MSDTAPRQWQRWRVALVDRTAPSETDRFARRAAVVAPAGESPEDMMAADPEGIRHALVARVRQEIEAGVYDSEEKWAAAEELLIRSIGGR